MHQAVQPRFLFPLIITTNESRPWPSSIVNNKSGGIKEEKRRKTRAACKMNRRRSERAAATLETVAIQLIEPARKQQQQKKKKKKTERTACESKRKESLKVKAKKDDNKNRLYTVCIYFLLLFALPASPLLEWKVENFDIQDRHKMSHTLSNIHSSFCFSFLSPSFYWLGFQCYFLRTERIRYISFILSVTVEKWNTTPLGENITFPNTFLFPVIILKFWVYNMICLLNIWFLWRILFLLYLIE